MSKMRFVPTITALFLIVAISAFAQTPNVEFASVQKGFVPAGDQMPLYREGRVMVKFTRDAVRDLAIHEAVANKAGQPLQLGLPSFDLIATPYRLTAIERALKLTLRDAFLAESLGANRWYALDFAPGDMQALAAILRQDPNVEDATPDYAAFPMAVPNDPLHPNHWGHNNTVQLPDVDWGGTYGHTLPTTVGVAGFDANAHAAWDGTQGYGSSGVIIAIIDSGVAAGHPDLLQVAGWDYGSGDSNPDDNSSASGHGTACAGVAAARANNSLGVAGIGGGCSIMPLKVANNAGSMFFSAIVNAIYHAADNGADIVSMSLGAAISSDAATDAAILYATNAGVVVMAATGNENRSTISYPAINANCMGIGAASPCDGRKRSSSSAADLNPGVSADPNSYTCDGERWWGSNYGSTTAGAAGAVDVIAPTILPTTDRLGAAGYDPSDYSLFFNGTSCSTPYVAGVAALIISKNPTWTVSQVKNQLTSTAQDIVNVESGAGWDRYSGYGMVNAAAAVGGGGGPVAPVANFSGTPTSGTAPLTVNFTDLSTNSPTSWSWTFGDGGTSTAQNPSRVYAAAGSYTVTLTATNAAGSDGETKTGYITVTSGGGTWVTITSDNFEAGMGNYTDGGADMSRYTGTTHSHQGAASADVQDNSGTSSSFYHTTTRNVSTYTDMDVSFWFKMVSVEVGENFYVEYYNGTAWQIVGNFVRGTPYLNTTFYNVTVTIPKATYTYPTNARLRFRCDASDNNDDVYIDEIVWRGLSGSEAVMDKADGVASLPQLFEMGQNHPNPFNPRTTIEFSLPTSERVMLRVFDLRGRQVDLLADGVFPAGRHEVVWAPQGIASGVYYYKLQAGRYEQTRQMTLLK
jgi:subtilisin family serine protease